jgi:hypothetical protein
VRAAGIHCFEFGTTLLQHLDQREPGELFNATNHYLPEADALLAEFVQQILHDLGLRR